MLTLRAIDGTWQHVATGFDDTPEGRIAAEHMLVDLERQLDTHRAAATAARKLGVTVGESPLLATYARAWGERRDNATADDDCGRIENHIIPGLGKYRLDELRPKLIRDFIESLKSKHKLGNRRKDGTRVPSDELLAPKTIRAIYFTLAKMLADAVADELLVSNPCVLKDELPAKVDKNRTWRRTAVFARGEVEAIISAPTDKVPDDRRVMYAVLFLGAMRFGEAAALTWRDYDPACSPLGKLVIERSYSSRKRDVKATKTDNPREMPVHPTLAKILAAWKLGGYERLTGRKPQPEDLIVPSRRGKHRNANHMLRRFHEDLERLGLRERRQHDARRTFISLARADGARPDILRWCTHGPTGDITDVYTTLPWPALCDEVAKLKIAVHEGKVIAMPYTAVAGERPRHLGDVMVTRSNVLLSFPLSRGADGTRTRGLRRDRPAL